MTTGNSDIPLFDVPMPTADLRDWFNILINEINGGLQTAIGSISLYPSRTIAALSHIPASVAVLQTAGYAARGDNGSAIYYRTSGNTIGGFQSLDGAWWGLAGNATNVRWTLVGDTDYTIPTNSGQLGALGVPNSFGLNATLTTTRTWTLPAANAVPHSWQITVADLIGGINFNPLALTAAGSDTINGQAAIYMLVPYGVMTLVSDGVSKWTQVALAGASDIVPNSSEIPVGDGDIVFAFDNNWCGLQGQFNRMVLKTPLSVSRTWTLPPANGMPPGWKLFLADAGHVTQAKTITVRAAGADTIDSYPIAGATSFIWDYPFANATLVTDGVSKWLVESTNQPNAARTRFWSNVDNSFTNPVSVFPWRERIMVGAAADYSDLTHVNPTFGWLTSSTGPNYLPRDAAVAVVNDNGGVGLSGSTRASDYPGGTFPDAIGVAGFGIGDVAGQGGWGGYFEAIRANNTATVFGIEVDVRNVANYTGNATPYGWGFGPHGVSIACGPGSDPMTGGYGPAPLNASGAGVLIGMNPAGGNTKRFSAGLLFTSDGILGTNGTDGEVVVPSAAITLARGQGIQWFAEGSVKKLTIASLLDSTDVDWTVGFISNSMVISRNSAAEKVLLLGAHASAVNYIQIDNQVTGSPPTISATGADTDIDLALITKGAGLLEFGTYTSKGAEAFAGFITIHDAAGNVRKLMVCA